MNIAENWNKAKAAEQPLPAPAELLPAHQRARALSVRGYGNVMLPLIPCGAPVSGQSRPANGKVPGEWNGTNWRNAWNWTKATSIDLGTWKTLREAVRSIRSRFTVDRVTSVSSVRSQKDTPRHKKRRRGRFLLKPLP